MRWQRQANQANVSMRPHRFTPLLAAAVVHDGQLTAKMYLDAGVDRSLWGLVITAPVKADLQIVARSAVDDDYRQPEKIVTGTRFPPLATTDRQPMRDVAPVSLKGLEQYLAALAVDMTADEVASVSSLYSERDKPTAIPYGVTITFHDGSAIFMYVRDTIAGQ